VAELKRKFLFLAIVIVLVLAAYFYVRPVKPLLSMSKAYNAGVGSTALINVTISNSPGCSSWNLNLTWDPYYVTITQGAPPTPGGPPLQVREGPLIVARNSSTFMYFMIIDLENGQLYVSDLFTNSNPQVYAAGDGVIFTLNFTVIRAGTSTIQFSSAGTNATGSIIGNAQNTIMDHDEVNGLITNEGPPPAWASTGFQTMLIYGEVGVLGVASVIIYVYANPRPPKAEKKKADFEPVIDTEDQA
jgi:hypothetical protein